MAKTIWRSLLILVFVVGLAVQPAPAALAAPTAASFTVTAKSAFLRVGPAFNAAPAYSVFAGQTYPIAGRTADNAWLLLAFPGAAAGSSWIAANLGTVTGDLAGVAVTGATGWIMLTATPTPPANSTPAPVSTSPAGPVFYTVAVKSLFARAWPAANATRLASLFEGERWPADARTADAAWLRLTLPAGPAWVPSDYGTLSAAAQTLPISGAAAATPTVRPTAGNPTLPPITVSEAARAIYQQGLALGNNARVFIKVGDCNSVTPFFLAAFDKGEYRLGSTYAYLQPVITNFAGSFNRDGAVARDGLNTASVFDSIWALPAVCQKGESPLACEVRTQKPSIAIVSLGTNGSWQTDAQYDTNMRKVLDYLIARGVLPILSTKADNLEGGDRFNQIVKNLAGEYQLPLWDFATPARALPGGGLADAYHLTWGQAYYDTAPTPLTGWQTRNLTALQALDTVWRAVKE